MPFVTPEAAEGGCAAVNRQLRCGYSAAAPRLEGITLAVMRLFGNFVAVNWAAAPRLLASSLRLMLSASVLLVDFTVMYIKVVRKNH